MREENLHAPGGKWETMNFLGVALRTHHLLILGTKGGGNNKNCQSMLGNDSIKISSISALLSSEFPTVWIGGVPDCSIRVSRSFAVEISIAGSRALKHP